MATAAEIWRDYVTDGVPSSGSHPPRKVDIRNWGVKLDRVRDRLQSAITYYVSLSGSDTNSGSIGSPFRTVGRAVTEVYNTADIGQVQVTIKIADGTYDEAVRLAGTPPFANVNSNAFPIRIEGNTTDWKAVKIRQGVYAYGGAKAQVYGVSFEPSAAGQWGIYVTGKGSLIQCGKLNFGAMSGGADHLMATDGGSFHVTDTYTINGGALNHYHVTEGSHGRVDAMVVQIETASLNFSGQFAGVASSDLFVIGVSFAGAGLASVTGRTYLAHLNGVIRTGVETRNIFPGNVSGVEQAGGRLEYNSVFSANLGGGSPITITAGGWTLIPFDTLDLERGDDFNVVNYSWTPRGGRIIIKGQVTFDNVPAGDQIGIAIYKNGFEFHATMDVSPGKYKTVAIELDYEESQGASSFQVYVYCEGAGSRSIISTPSWTFFQGQQL
ncbi:hypothetical protein BTE77_06625 [Ensifer adhaerens]|nr:hypothetical protein BTE77_06625 [Ensifer adhaerens]